MDDHITLAERIMESLRKPEKAKEMRKTARQRVENFFTV
jgi:hypothetical protein